MIVLVLAVLSLLMFLSVAYVHYREDLAAARHRLGSESILIHLSSGQTEYATFGKGFPVVILHGAGGGYDQGLLFARANVDTCFQHIAVSRFGYLRTPLPDDASPAAQADAVRELIDSLGLAEVAVMGISAGGPSALHFAARYPERCAALFLVSAISHTSAPETYIQRMVYNTMMASDFMYWLTITYFTASLAPLIGIPQDIYDEMTPAQRDSLSFFLKSILPFSLRRDGTNNDRKIITDSLACRFDNITVLTLIIHTRNDQQVPFTHAQYAKDRIPHARLIVLDKGGHFLIGQYNTVKKTVSAFLRQHGAAE